MSDILIKGMDMPKTVFECSTKINPEERRCNYTGKVFEETFSLLTQRRCDNCPLVEIPTPHGQLIDVDALQRKIIETVNSGDPDEQFTARDVIQLIENAPTIIEAEE